MNPGLGAEMAAPQLAGGLAVGTGPGVEAASGTSLKGLGSQVQAPMIESPVQQGQTGMSLGRVSANVDLPAAEVSVSNPVAAKGITNAEAVEAKAAGPVGPPVASGIRNAERIESMKAAGPASVENTMPPQVASVHLDSSLAQTPAIHHHSSFQQNPSLQQDSSLRQGPSVTQHVSRTLGLDHPVAHGGPSVGATAHIATSATPAVDPTGQFHSPIMRLVEQVTSNPVLMAGAAGLAGYFLQGGAKGGLIGAGLGAAAAYVMPVVFKGMKAGGKA